jgi:hypothetical protein
MSRAPVAAGAGVDADVELVIEGVGGLGDGHDRRARELRDVVRRPLQDQHLTGHDRAGLGGRQLELLVEAAVVDGVHEGGGGVAGDHADDACGDDGLGHGVSSSFGRGLSNA